MKERFHAKDEKSLMLRFHTQTAGSTLTAQQPDNNIPRVTIQALSAVLGGTQSLHTNSRDEALSLPTEESVRIALRTQQIIAEESGVTDTVDPLGGSYFVEALTDKLEKDAMSYIEKIDEMGGMVEAIEKGYVQREIQKEAYRFQKELENKERIVVGMNKYQTKEESLKNLLKLDPAIQKNQIEKLKNIKEMRDNKLVSQSLNELKEAAKGKENLMPYIINSVKAYSTLGEISNVLKEIFGEYNENVVV
jgi:methylmalonyl-CoA mutase N-terminal domain/subunit